MRPSLRARTGLGNQGDSGRSEQGEQACVFHACLPFLLLGDGASGGYVGLRAVWRAAGRSAVWMCECTGDRSNAPAPRAGYLVSGSDTAVPGFPDLNPAPGGADGEEPMLRIAACLVLACAFAGPATAGRGLLIGVADDSLKWNDRTRAEAALSYSRDLGLRAVRVTVPWQSGETRLPVDQREPVDRMILATWGKGLRVVLAVYGRAGDAPQTGGDRDAYCAFVASLLRRYPGVNDVVIWNEPNSSRFWRPQFTPDGASLAPADYEALLARCWDVLHAVRPSVNVIAASAPRGNDDPRASSNVSHSPVSFYRRLGEAYRASGRRLPILDTVGHNPYPRTNAERPWAHHPGGTIGEGDYDKLMRVLQEAFAGTAQPLPGQGRVSIWYMEQGFETAVDPAKTSLYKGRESDPHVLPPWVIGSAAGTLATPAPDQATQLRDALELAYCQPRVGAFFNFELADEPGLDGWQSGLLWADLTPKPSFQPFKTAIRDVSAGRVDCRRFAEPGIGFTTRSSAAPSKKAAKKPAPVIVVE